MNMNMLPFMGPPCELTLNYSPTTNTSPLVGDEEESVDKLEEYLKGLEEERFKIEAFKRELPFSMQLLNDVIQASKWQLANYESRKSLTREKFIPVNKTCEESKVAISSAKHDVSDWMRSAGLWSHRHGTEQDTIPHLDSYPQKPFAFCGTANYLSDYKNRVGGAFLPFSKERQQTSSCSEAKETVEANDPTSNTSDGANSNSDPNLTSPPSTKRKVRRCWSPELHHKFVSALQQLGGAHATPKHIRELMKVEGLTNDEVKSHLQKYRLHTRRASPNRPQSCEQSHGAQLVMVVVGGIWVPQPQPHYYCQEASTCIAAEESIYTLKPSYNFQQAPQDAWKEDSSH